MDTRIHSLHPVAPWWYEVLLNEPWQEMSIAKEELFGKFQSAGGRETRAQFWRMIYKIAGPLVGQQKDYGKRSVIIPIGSECRRRFNEWLKFDAFAKDEVKV